MHYDEQREEEQQKDSDKWNTWEAKTDIASKYYL